MLDEKQNPEPRASGNRSGPAQRRPSGRHARPPPGATFLRLMGVDYFRIRTADGGDLYVTEHGMPFLDHLRPENWYETEWFKRTELPCKAAAPSTVFRPNPIPLTAARASNSLSNGRAWGRIFPSTPSLSTASSTPTLIRLSKNSPCLRKLRSGNVWFSKSSSAHPAPHGYLRGPPERHQLWQTGRSRHKIVSKVLRHASVEIDILRSYIMLYAWIDGIDAVEAQRLHLFQGTQPEESLRSLNSRVISELNEKGFAVVDHKPSHVIVRAHNGRLMKRQSGSIAYALVDYELLSRTEAYEIEVKKSLRSRYLSLQRDRLHPVDEQPTPAHLMRTKLLGVDLSTARPRAPAGSCGSSATIRGCSIISSRAMAQQAGPAVGFRAHLVFRVPRTACTWSGRSRASAMSPSSTFCPRSWMPCASTATTARSRNSIWPGNEPLRNPHVYPRAIYVTAESSEPAEEPPDARRFWQYCDLLAPDGRPALRDGPDYVTVWGYFRGWEDKDAVGPTVYWSPSAPARRMPWGS